MLKILDKDRRDLFRILMRILDFSIVLKNTTRDLRINWEIICERNWELGSEGTERKFEYNNETY